MPKQKTHQGVKDRFRITKNKRVLARKASRNHHLSKKSPSTKRTLAKLKVVTGKIGKNILKRS